MTRPGETIASASMLLTRTRPAPKGQGRGRYRLLLALLAATWAAQSGGPGRAADDAADATPTLRSRQQALERFRKLDAEERLQRAEEAAGGKLLLYSVTAADVEVTVTERGTLEAAQASDVICHLRAHGKGSTVASTIKWLIEDGSQVKKGERLVELDDSELRDELLLQKISLEKATADKVTAEENLQITQKQNQLDMRTAEINFKLARLQLKKFAGKDEDEKEILALKVQQAQLRLDALKLQIKARTTAAETQIKMKTAIAHQEAEKKQDIEAQLAQCVIHAPQAGMVIYIVSETARFGGASAIVAQGEPVREGQKLMRVSNLERFGLTCRVHEALVGAVRVGQAVTVRVDAYPRKVLRGRVKGVATVAAPADFFSADVKVYPVEVAIMDKLTGLKPGMSAVVRIEVARQRNVLRVPVGSVLQSGRETFCFVKVGKGLEERPVKTGLRNDFFVEIKEGLKKGERVLWAPHGVAGLILAKARRSSQILVRTIRLPPGPVRRRSRVQSFGFTNRDLEQISALPYVTEVAPVRSFPMETRHLAHLSRSYAIATVGGYPRLAGIRLEAGRFLDDEDDLYMHNVAVLGAETALDLFPQEDPIGKVVRLGSALTSFVVVGVLRNQEKPAGSLVAQQVNHAVYIPLRTCQGRFGKVLVFRRVGRFDIEAVALNEILVAVESPRQVPLVVKSIAALMVESHPRNDWDARAAMGGR